MKKWKTSGSFKKCSVTLGYWKLLLVFVRVLKELKNISTDFQIDISFVSLIKKYIHRNLKRNWKISNHSTKYSSVFRYPNLPSNFSWVLKESKNMSTNFQIDICIASEIKKNKVENWQNEKCQVIVKKFPSLLGIGNCSWFLFKYSKGQRIWIAIFKSVSLLFRLLKKNICTRILKETEKRQIIVQNVPPLLGIQTFSLFFVSARRETKYEDRILYRYLFWFRN